MNTETYFELAPRPAADFITDAIVDYKQDDLPILALMLPVPEEDRVAALECAELHEHNNRRFAKQPKFFRGKNHLQTIVRGYLGEIVIRKALGLPHGLHDLVFDKPQKRPDLLDLDGYNLRLDMKTTEDGTVRVNERSHLSEAKRPFAYLIADIRGALCFVYVAEADQVDLWPVKRSLDPFYYMKMPEPPLLH